MEEIPTSRDQLGQTQLYDGMLGVYELTICEKQKVHRAYKDVDGGC